MRNLVYFGYGNWMNDSVCDIESLAPEWMNGFCVFSCPMSTGHILNDCYSRGVVWLTIHWMDPRTTRLCILTTVAMVLFSLQMLTGSQSRYLPDWMALLHGHLTVCGTHTPGQ